MDYVAELRYALVFQSLGFAITVEPLGQKGPDLGVTRDGLSAVVEVTRFRAMNPGPPEIDGELLAEYGNPARDVRKSLRKLARKFRQLDGGQSIIAVWNDDDALDDLEVSLAAHELSGGRDTPNSLQFVLYGSSWTLPGRELLCLPVRDLDGGVQQWVRDLEMVNVRAAVRSVGNCARESADLDEICRGGYGGVE